MAQSITLNKHYRWWYRKTVLPIIIVILIIYFETFYHYWFLKLLGGYNIKVWLLPFGLFFFFLFRKMIQGSLNFPNKKISYLNFLIIIYVLSGFGALLVHETLWNIGKYSLLMFTPVMLYMSIIYGIRDNKDIERILKLLLVVGLIYAAYTAYLFYYVGPNEWRLEPIKRTFMFSDTTVVFDPNKIADFYMGGNQGRIIRSSLPGIDQPKFGGMLAPLVLVGFYFAINSKGCLRIFYYTSALFLIFTIMSTLARSSILALFVGITLFFLAVRKKLTGLLFGISICGLTAVILIFTEGAIDRIIHLLGSIDFLGQTELINKLATKRGIEFTEDGHITSYFEGIKVFKDAPLHGILGMGIQNFEDIFSNNRWGVPHNRYMYLLDTVGLMTLIPYIGFIIALIFVVRRTFLNRLKTHYYSCNLGLIFYPSIVLLAIKLNNEGMETYYYWIFFGLAVAWIRNLAYEEKNENTAN